MFANLKYQNGKQSWPVQMTKIHLVVSKLRYKRKIKKNVYIVLRRNKLINMVIS